jgi:N-methylhydantoinase B/oxoprolinase/acetone carboxylase alpha subunit
VAEDLRNGFISRKSAREVYKVVVRDDGSVDIDGTKALRSRSRVEGG